MYDNSGEIAAWDSSSQARHGFAAGTRIPNKAYRELKRLFPNSCGLNGKVPHSRQSFVPIRHQPNRRRPRSMAASLWQGKSL